MASKNTDMFETDIGHVIDRRSAMLAFGASASAIFLPGFQSPASALGSIPTWTLDGGVKMPTLALNTVGLSVEDTERAIRFAR